MNFYGEGDWISFGEDRVKLQVLHTPFRSLPMAVSLLLPAALCFDDAQKAGLEVIGLIRDTMDYFLDRALQLGHRWATRYMINISTNGTLGDDEPGR